MNLFKKISIFAIFIALSMAYACQKENIEPQTVNKSFEKSKAGPNIIAVAIPFCSGKPIISKYGCPIGVGNQTSYNWLKINLNPTTYGYYSNSVLNYKIYEASTNNLVFNCDRIVTSYSYSITSANGLSNNTTYKVVISDTNNESATIYVTTGSCGGVES